MHHSRFSYPISKPYPFRWFTPVALVGGLVLAVLLSLLNLSANGFYLKTVYTSDPNSTEAHANAQWFRQRPFNWQSDVQAECQPHLLSVGDSFFTTNLGFRYTIKAITDPAKTSLSTIGYKNNTLQSCIPKEIELRLRKSDTAAPPAPSRWLSWIDSSILATFNCTIATDDGLMTITVTTEYSGSGDQIYSYVIEDDYKTHASVWWGTRILNAYWNGVLATASRMTQVRDGKKYVVRAHLYYTLNPFEKDIQDDNFFNLYWWTGNDDSSGPNKNDLEDDEGYHDYNSDWYVSPSLTEGLHCTKILSSLLSLDLGSCQSPSLLLDDNGLEYAILAPNDSNRAPGNLLNGSASPPDGIERFNRIPSPVPNSTNKRLTDLKDSFDKFHSLMGPLGCKNATIVDQYLCSVPQQKSWGVLLFSILLADLVFLQAAWKVLTWTADALVKKDNPEAMSCEGHRTQSESFQALDSSSTFHHGFRQVPCQPRKVATY
ncbi:hypothetical protein GQ607_016446 [Colletotrichum asianum]|uniref:Uncharacterized protein n=1 Tax=Colletotrichum asianum TaxID=702518 RepID=A0A8H3ZJZ4_9PEZI|nr:hypothetical protein GQ607_016446 [Colletotrichum asianum]